MAENSNRRRRLLLVVVSLFALAGDAGAQGSAASDKAALTALYNGTGGDSWEHSTNWLTEAPLRDWYGVEADANGRVTVVSLTRNTLTGQIPAELGDLDRLEELWLTGNDLSGAIPAELGSLASLEVLSLAVNGLSGSIPVALGNLTSLEQLNLNDNRLSSSIPPGLGNLFNLVDVSLDDNALSGSIPDSLGNLNRLRWLNLARNQLTGAIPEGLWNLVQLESLYLGGNAALSGVLPLDLMSLSRLGSLDISNTGLCGPDDDDFEAWTATIDFLGCSRPGAPPPTPPPAGGGGATPGGGEDEDDGDDGDDGGDSGGAADGASPKAAFTHGMECAAGLCRAETGHRVLFEDTSTGSVRFRRWDFGAGPQSRGQRADHAWSAPGFYEVTLWVSDGSNEATASVMLLVESSDPAGICESDEATLCLQDSRYAVQVERRTSDGTSGPGRVVHAGTNDSGLFRFFDGDNWEVLIKVLDACALNGNVWVFGLRRRTSATRSG